MSAGSVLKVVALGALAVNMYAVSFGFSFNGLNESTTSNNSTQFDFTGSQCYRGRRGTQGPAHFQEFPLRFSVNSR